MRLRILIILSTVFLSFSLNAASLPNCWQDGMKKGDYLVTIDLDACSKESLVEILRSANGEAIMPGDYPIFVSSMPVAHLLVSARLNMDGVPLPQNEVEAEMLGLIKLQGVSKVECNFLAGPFPRMGVGN